MDSDRDAPKQENVRIEGIVIDQWKLRLPSFFGSISSEFVMPIGLITFIWGSFETMFDNFLTAVLLANNKLPSDVVGRLTLRQRLSRCREETAVALAPLVGTLAYLNSILKDVPDLYMMRNLVVHGHLATAINSVERDGNMVAEVRLACLGRYRGKDIRQDFSKDDLENVFYDIAHLCGRIHAVSTASAALPSTEIPQLRAFLETHHPTYPIPSNLPPPPQPSQG